MSPSASQPPTVTHPPEAESAGTVAPSALAGARQRVANLIASSGAGLRSFDRTLEDLARRDWSVSTVAKNLEAAARDASSGLQRRARERLRRLDHLPDRKSTRLNSSHSSISYAVFCLKKKKNTQQQSRLYKKHTHP